MLTRQGPAGLLPLSAVIMGRRIASRSGRALAIAAFALSVWPLPAAHGQSSVDVAAEITRLRGRLAEDGAQEQHCLAGATQPVWTPALATDLKMLQERANQAAGDGAADGQRWKELARKAEILQARATMSARSGAELFQSQEIGLGCLDRFAGEREALRASLELAVADPTAYGESLRQVREHGTAPLRQDLSRLREQGRALATRWKQAHEEASTEARGIKSDLDGLRRRHTAALEGAPARALADPILRAAEALVAAADAWERERAAATRHGAAADEVERRRTAGERDEAARQARDYRETAERLLARRVPRG